MNAKPPVMFGKKDCIERKNMWKNDFQRDCGVNPSDGRAQGDPMRLA